jgi:hypothetical protein
MSRRPGARRAAPRAARPPRRAPQAWRALLIALGLLLAQGPLLLHLLLVRHVACEHGELVEQAAPAHAIARESGPAHDRVDAAAPGSGHEHCDVLAVRHCPGDVAAPIVAPSLLCIEPPASLCARGETRPVALLSLAPKSSPPAA